LLAVVVGKGTLMFRWLRRDPRRLPEQRRRMLDGLADYPIYEPPHHQGPNFRHKAPDESMDEYRQSTQEFLARGKENFIHLMAGRDERLAALQRFLYKFDVVSGTDEAGLRAVSAWCPGNCGTLVTDLRKTATRQAFFQFAPWTGQWRGLNVIFDLSIFFGECIITRNQKLYWKYLSGTSEGGYSNSSGYYVSGYKSFPDSFDAANYMYGLCTNDAAENLNVDVLVGVVRDRSTR
jgi:hypothetical protein